MAKPKKTKRASRKPRAIKPGDVVVLKCGGPAMTVGQTSDCGLHVECYWFAMGQPSRHSFPIACLKPVAPSR